MSRPALALRSKALLLGTLALAACTDPAPDGPSLSKPRSAAFRVGDRIPEGTESSVVGALEAPVVRGSPAYARLVRCEDERILFKDEEKTGADRMMTTRLRVRLLDLAERVEERWPDVTLRVTETWDEEREHGKSSVHYEGRAADLTTSDLDPRKLGWLAKLAVDAGFDWVFYEDETHVHVSVRR
jgi:hypothetical protein